MTLVAELIDTEADLDSGVLERHAGLAQLHGRIAARALEQKKPPLFHEHRGPAHWSQSAHDDVSTWQGYARRLLFSIAGHPDGAITYKTVNLCLELLTLVMDRDSVYPSITPDEEGGLSFEWSSGPWLVELDLEANGEYLFLHTGLDGGVALHERGMIRNLPVQDLKTLVRQFTKYVAGLNPAWRSFYA